VKLAITYNMACITKSKYKLYKNTSRHDQLTVTNMIIEDSGQPRSLVTLALAHPINVLIYLPFNIMHSNRSRKSTSMLRL